MRIGRPGRIGPALLRGFVLLAAGAPLAPAQPGRPADPPESIRLERLDDPAGLEARLRSLIRSGEGRVTVPGGEVHRGEFVLAAGQKLPGHLLVLEGDATISGPVAGNVVVLDGNLILHPGALVQGEALVIGGRIQERGGTIHGERRALASSGLAWREPAGGAAAAGMRLAGVTGVLATLALLGFGLVLFSRPRLEVISDTAAHRILRSFLTGLLAQIVAIPTAGLLLAGLVMSVVGILLVPFVAVVLPLLLVVALVVGFLAVAHAMGEAHLRRKMAAGVPVGSPNSHRYVLIGLGGIGALWLVWVGFAWVPLAGTLVLLLAAVTTWALTTVGLGAFLLSRAGMRPGFTGRLVPPEALTDEYLWATPQLGVTAIKRPDRR